MVRAYSFTDLSYMRHAATYGASHYTRMKAKNPPEFSQFT